MTDIMRTKELEKSSFVEPLKPLPSFTKKQRETYDDLLKKNFSAVNPRNKTTLFKKVIKNGDSKLVEQIVKNIIEYDMGRTKKSKSQVENDLRLKLPKDDRAVFVEILKNVDSMISKEPKSESQMVEETKRTDRLLDDFSGPSYTIDSGANPRVQPVSEQIKFEPILNQKQKEIVDPLSTLDLSKAREVMTKENFEKLKTAYSKLNSIVNEKSLEDGSFFTKGAAALGAPELEVLQMASNMLGLGFNKKDKSDLRKILDGEDTGRGATGDIGLVAKMFLNPDEIGGVISHQSKKWGKRIADDASDFWNSVRGRKADIYTRATDLETKDLVQSRQKDIKNQIHRDKELARLEGKAYKGEEYDPDTLNRLLEMPKLSQYGGRDDFDWDEKLGRTFLDLFGINPNVNTGSKKEKLERELQERDPEGYRRYREALKKYEVVKKKIGIRSRNSNIQSEHGAVRRQLGDIIKEALDDNSSLIKAGKDAVFNREQIEDYYDLAEWLKSNDEMSYHNLAQIADNFLQDTKGKLSEKLDSKINQWTGEQEKILGILGQGDLALDIGSDEGAKADVEKRVAQEAKVIYDEEERKKRKKEHDDIIKQEEIDKENEETLNRRKDVTHKGFVNTDNNGIPDLRPRIIFGDTDGQLMETPEEIAEERRTIDTMLMWNARNETEQNKNDNVLYQLQQENERRRYGMTYDMPKPPKPLDPVPEEILRYNQKLWIPMYNHRDEQYPPMRDPMRNNDIFSKPESIRAESSSQKVEFASRRLLYPETWLRERGPILYNPKEPELLTRRLGRGVINRGY